jgi:tetratricopeptide (TPR) repeat protein
MPSAPNQALAELSTHLRDLIAARGTNNSALERRTGYRRQSISDAVNGHHVPSADLAQALDDALRAGGRIVGLRNAADREKKARRLNLDPTPPAGEEDGATDRREFLELGALSALALATHERIDTSIVDSRLADLEADAYDIAAAYGSVPYTQTLAAVTPRWRQLEQILDGRVAPQARGRVVTLAGQFTHFLGRLAFNVGDLRAAGRFGGLASRYAQEANDPVLTLSIAALYSGIAYWRQDYPGALAALHTAGDLDDPYLSARMAAYDARTYARLGRFDEARAALDRMEATVCTAPPRPGETPVGPAAMAMFRAGLALRIGDLAMAREWGPVAVAAYRHGGPDCTLEERQHAELDWAMVLMADRRVEPEAAALAAREALALVPTPTHTIISKAGELARSFAPEHRRLPEVSAFTETMRALPRGESGR